MARNRNHWEWRFESAISRSIGFTLLGLGGTLALSNGAFKAPLPVDQAAMVAGEAGAQRFEGRGLRRLRHRLGRRNKSCDPQRMSVMFFGADAGRKRTALIEAFVRVRLPGLLKLRTRNFRATLQSEIAQIFDIRLSGETLRILIAGMKPAVLPTKETADAPTDEPAYEPAYDPQRRARLRTRLRAQRRPRLPVHRRAHRPVRSAFGTNERRTEPPSEPARSAPTIPVDLS